MQVKLQADMRCIECKYYDLAIANAIRGKLVMNSALLIVVSIN